MTTGTGIGILQVAFVTFLTRQNAKSKILLSVLRSKDSFLGLTV